MPIETKDGTTVITGEAINLARLLALKGMLKLEMKGMRRRGRSALTILQGMGFKGSTRTAVLSKVEAYIDIHGPDMASR